MALLFVTIIPSVSFDVKISVVNVSLTLSHTFVKRHFAKWRGRKSIVTVETHL